MRFDIITIFPEVFGAYFNESILKRAQEKKLIEIKTHNLRDYTEDKHRTVDDKPFGGGAGMVMKVEPIYKAVEKIKNQKSNLKNKEEIILEKKINSSPFGKGGQGDFKNKRKKVILLSAKGKKFDQKMARQLAKLDQVIFICGRYEGVDERVAKKVADMEVSVGDYVLTGGELPAMIIVDAVSRLIPCVIKKESLAEESYGKDGALEYPQYTRPENFMGWKVPKVLLEGHHKKIGEWRKAKSKIKSQKSKTQIKN